MKPMDLIIPVDPILGTPHPDQIRNWAAGVRPEFDWTGADVNQVYDVQTDDGTLLPADFHYYRVSLPG